MTPQTTPGFLNIPIPAALPLCLVMGHSSLAHLLTSAFTQCNKLEPCGWSWCGSLLPSHMCMMMMMMMTKVSLNVNDMK